MAPIRIAHLSDVHLPGPLPRGTEWLGKRGLSGLSWLRKRHEDHSAEVIEALTRDLLGARPDVIAVTGDLVNFALEREFEPAAKWLARLGPPERVIVTPGNHDAMAGRWQDAISRHWSAYRGRVLEIGPIALISVCSALVTPPFFASGRVSAAALRSMRDDIAAAAARGLCPVVLIHHPPTPITAPRKSLRGAAAVSRAMAQAGAALVLHGHTHHADVSEIDGPQGPVPVRGVASFSTPDGRDRPAGGWHMIEIERAGEGWHARITGHHITADGSVRAGAAERLHLAALAPVPAADSM